jgi:purine-binding chemotaxis protein CheW
VAELFLIVRLAGQRVALRAAEVDSVVEVEALTPVPGTAPHIRGLTALRSRVLTVIDCLAAFDPDLRLPDGSTEAVMAVVDGHPYALLVEGVEDVVEAEIEESVRPAGPQGSWRRISRLTVDAGGDLMALVDVAALVAGPEAAERAA